MQIKTFVLSEFQMNCYVVYPDDPQNRCVIIDPGIGPEPVIDFCQDNQLTPTHLLLTHGHGDHIAGLTQLKQHYPQALVAVSNDDAEFLIDPNLNLSAQFGFPLPPITPDLLLTDQQTLDLNGLECRVIACPGHTPGGVSFYFPHPKTVFTGDSLFAGSIGRTDFPRGDYAQLLTAIRQQLLTLPDDTAVYSGHGPKTTIGQEKSYNPFL